MFKNYISRPMYVEKVKPYFSKDLIKVLIGQRRCGKSFLMFEIMDLLVSEGKIEENNVIYINKELSDFRDIVDEKSLLEHIEVQKKTINGKKKIALFIDEVQEIVNFEKALRSLQAKGGFDIYISGSNANILSTELSTFLSGRYVEIEIFPLSYGEFLRFHGFEGGEDSLSKYIRYGGLPYLIHLELEDDIVYPYLRNVYDSIILKDIVRRYKIRNVNLLQSLNLFLADNVGSLVSAKKISDFLKKERINISPSVILNYLNYLNSVYLILDVKRRSLGKKIFEIGSKHYFTDLGLRHAISSYQLNDVSKVLENLVYMELRRQGYDVFVGKIDDMEIDFIAEKQGKRKYVQVCYLLESEKTIEREFGNLLKIEDNFEKVVVSMDGGEGVMGVKHLSILEFLNE